MASTLCVAAKRQLGSLVQTIAGQRTSQSQGPKVSCRFWILDTFARGIASHGQDCKEQPRRFRSSVIIISWYMNRACALTGESACPKQVPFMLSVSGPLEEC